MNKLTKTMIVILGLAMIISCGTESKNKVQKQQAEKSKEIISIEINAIGESMAEIAFEPKEVNIKSGTRVKLTFNNKSSAAGMLHNFILVELGAGQEIASAGLKAGKNKDFKPNDSRIIVATKVLDLGAQLIIEFDAPKKGSYHYICTYPGHYPKMIGRLNVI